MNCQNEQWNSCIHVIQYSKQRHYSLTFRTNLSSQAVMEPSDRSSLSPLRAGQGLTPVVIFCIATLVKPFGTACPCRVVPSMIRPVPTTLYVEESKLTLCPNPTPVDLHVVEEVLVEAVVEVVALLDSSTGSSLTQWCFPPIIARVEYPGVGFVGARGLLDVPLA